MEEIKSKTESLAHEIAQYCDISLKIGVINATQKTSTFAAKGFTALLVLIISVLIILFLSVGAAMWVGEELQNVKAGYFIMGGFYVIIAIVLIALRKNILYPFVRNYITKQVYEQNNDL